MKIGVITIPIFENYGGILQAYALQSVLNKMGHDVTLLVDYKAIKYKPFYLWPLVLISRLFVRYIKQDTTVHIFHEKWAKMQHDFLTQHQTLFIKENIRITQLTNIKDVSKLNLSAIVVGSDQVWRPKYVNPIDKYFLSFLSKNSKIKRIAYAVSFGTKEWEYSRQQTKRCAKLAQKFDCISVREKSGIELCRRYLKVTALFVLDPTLLLNKEDYISLLPNLEQEVNYRTIFTYILDKSEEKDEFINEIKTKLKLIQTNIDFNDKSRPYCSVENWLMNFYQAQFIVTDSFHGCVFSIIFNKPFLVINNPQRGQERFESLLSTFDLKDRLIDLNNFDLKIIEKKINWDKINQIKKVLQNYSIQTLYNSLS